jgi:carbonic anhydrase
VSFCTVINCMDGRVQLPVNEYLCRELSVDYVDTITEAGPVRILSEEQQSALADSILARVDISVKKHKSKTVAIVAHYDCAGNPVKKDLQLEQLESAIDFLNDEYPDIKIFGLWVDSDWNVEQIF